MSSPGALSIGAYEMITRTLSEAECFQRSRGDVAGGRFLRTVWLAMSFWQWANTSVDPEHARSQQLFQLMAGTS